MFHYDSIVCYLFKGIESFKCNQKGWQAKVLNIQNSAKESPPSSTTNKEEVYVELSARGYELLNDKLELCLYHVKTLDELVRWVQNEMCFLQFELKNEGLLIPQDLEERINERFKLLGADLK